DHLEHVGGGCLLREGLAQLVEQPSILDRNHGLIGKRGEQLDLFIAERLYDRARHGEHADWGAFPQKRDPEHSSEATALLRSLPDVLRLGKHSRDMHDASCQRGSANKSPSAGLDRLCFHILLVFERVTVISRQGYFSPSRRKTKASCASHRRAADSTSVLSTACKSKAARLRTLRSSGGAGWGRGGSGRGSGRCGRAFTRPGFSVAVRTCAGKLLPS